MRCTQLTTRDDHAADNRARRVGSRGPIPVAALAPATLVLAGCVTGGAGAPPERVYAHAARYLVSCSVSDECRVTYLDQEGVLRRRDVVGEWNLEVGADPGHRLWVRAGSGGCPPRPVRVTIMVDGDDVAEQLARAPGSARCEWILAETEFTVPEG